MVRSGEFLVVIIYHLVYEVSTLTYDCPPIDMLSPKIIPHIPPYIILSRSLPISNHRPIQSTNPKFSAFHLHLENHLSLLLHLRWNGHVPCTIDPSTCHFKSRCSCLGLVFRLCSAFSCSDLKEVQQWHRHLRNGVDLL